MNWIRFKGISSLDYGMVVERMPSRPVPVRALKKTAVPGRSGSLFIDEGTYADIELTVALNCYGSEAIGAVELNEWLQGRGDLILSDMEERRYNAHIVKAPAITRRRTANGQNFDTVSVSFTCEPFTYEATPEVLTLPYPTIIPGEGTIDAEPEIIVNGTGDVVLTVGGSVLTLEGLTGSITIDSAKRLAYSGTTSLAHKVAGDWPVMSVESTEISWTGTVSNVIVTPNWRWL